MPSHTVENYLKQIYLEHQHGDRALVPMGQLASAMEVTPGTATSMMKTLAEARLVDYEPRGGVRLTDAGTTLALQVLRRHRLLELFLVEVLGLDWSEVHAEAEILEHAVSEKVLSKIDSLLSYPDTDPHGDPIPPAVGNPRGRAKSGHRLSSLADCPVDAPLRVARVLDQAPGFLQFVDEHGLTPGASLVVASRSPAADAVTIHAEAGPDGENAVTIGSTAASKILVEPAVASSASLDAGGRGSV